MFASTNNYAESLAAAVRAELARQRRPGSDLAALLGVSRATAYRLLNGDPALNANQIERIASGLGMTEADLLESAEFGRRLKVAA